MSFGSFSLGFFLMAVGFACVRYTDALLRYFGDISEVFGFLNAQWLSWKVVGIIMIVIGFMIAFGLLTLFLQVTVGNFFNLGGI